MNPRHAAALASIVWYLMMPPLADEHNPEPWSAPLSQWLTVGEFGSIDTCRSALDEKTIAAGDSAEENDDEAATANRRILKARCIASDDPRLKER
jgi:hypothetical protein